MQITAKIKYVHGNYYIHFVYCPQNMFVMLHKSKIRPLSWKAGQI